MAKRSLRRGVMRSIRRKSALDLLQTQLKSGVKTQKGTVDKKVPLTDKDKGRIEREIVSLKERV